MIQPGFVHQNTIKTTTWSIDKIIYILCLYASYIFYFTGIATPEDISFFANSNSFSFEVGSGCWVAVAV